VSCVHQGSWNRHASAQPEEENEGARSGIKALSCYVTTAALPAHQVFYVLTDPGSTA
jgi:hypothetical protein